jgi:hypothetical protein
MSNAPRQTLRRLFDAAPMQKGGNETTFAKNNRNAAFGKAKAPLAKPKTLAYDQAAGETALAEISPSLAALARHEIVTPNVDLELTVALRAITVHRYGTAAEINADMPNDGNLVIYSRRWEVLWPAGTGGIPSAPAWGRAALLS